MDREIEKLKLEKKDLIKRIINLVNDVVELDRRIYKALCIIDEKKRGIRYSRRTRKGIKR